MAAAFELSFSNKRIKKKKVSGEIVIVLISLFHVQIQSLQEDQLPQQHLSFLRNLLSQNIWNK